MHKVSNHLCLHEEKAPILSGLSIPKEYNTVHPKHQSLFKKNIFKYSWFAVDLLKNYNEFCVRKLKDTSNNFDVKITIDLVADLMKRLRKKNSRKKNINQLTFDFTQNVPIEIHIPRQISVNYKKEFTWNKKMMIEFVSA